MKVVINNIVYDSRDVPILLIFNSDEEQLMMGMKRFVSAPENSTQEERQKLIDMEIDD